jgi:hypothetical protein
MADKVDDRRDRRVAALAAEEWGVLSVDELRGCGLSRDAIAIRARKGRLHRLYRGVYAVGHPNVALQGRFLAAVKACGPGAVLSHFSAAALWGFVPWDGRCPEVTVRGAGTRQHAGIRVHRTTRLERRDLARREGVPITAPARTVVDIASLLDRRALRRAVREAQSIGRVTLHLLVEAIHRLGPCPGVRELGHILSTGPAPTRSVLEDEVLDLILRGGLAHPDVNVPLHVAGRTVVPDFRWPEQRLIVEADGAAWHDTRLAREDDAERQALLEAHGEHVLRVTWAQAVSQPRETLARLRAAGAPSAHRLSS